MLFSFTRGFGKLNFSARNNKKKTLPKNLNLLNIFYLKIANAFLDVTAAISAKGRLYTSATLLATSCIYELSFLFPRKGTGAK